MKRKYSLLNLVGVILIYSFANAAFAAGAPYLSYTYDFWGRAVPAPQAYLPSKVINGATLGLDNLNAPRDVFITDDGEVFIADTGNHRIVILNENFELERMITGFMKDDEEQRFSSPTGLYVTSEGHLYVADRDNGRIVVLGPTGEFLRILPAPEPDADGIITPDFRYRPRKVGVDQANRVYVVAEDVYDGILEFDQDGSFRGFIGAPRVVFKFKDYVWRALATKDQRERMLLFLPTEYSNLDIDERGFLYTTVATQDVNELDAIRRLNPSGADVLRRRGFQPPMGDYGSVFLDEEGKLAFPRSGFVDIVAREHGTYSAIERTRGRIFTYDAEGNLLYVFGGMGGQEGTFQVPSAIAAMGDRLVTIDSRRNEITVFEPTKYAQMIHSAIASHYSGEYDEASRLWTNILSLNGNYDLAYTGIGQAMLRMDRYEEAMVYFKAGQNRKDYSEAYALYRRERAIRYFSWAMYTLFAWWIFCLVNRKRGWTKVLRTRYREYRGLAHSETAATQLALGSIRAKIMRYGESFGYSLYVINHPFDGFWDLKHEKRGTVSGAISFVGLLTLTYVFMRQYTGFIFNTRRLDDLNIFVEIGSVVIPFFLWSVVSWSLTTLMDGKGTFRDIVIATAYSLVPLILMNIPLTLFSNIITMQEGAFYYLLLAVALIWSMGLLIFGTMVTHDYTMWKTLLTCFLVLVGIVVVLFIVLLLIGVSGQVIGFVRDVYLELVFRR